MVCSVRPAKKPRLSNDTDDLPVSPRSPIVEAVAPDTADDASYGATIILEDDIEDMYSSYRQQFAIDNELAQWRDTIRSNYYFALDSLAACKDAIQQHLTLSQNEPQLWLQKYHEDEGFLADFGEWFLELLKSTEVVDPTDGDLHLDADSMIADLYSSAAALSARIVTLLPDLITIVLRRDSAQPPRLREQPVPLLVYVHLLALLTASNTPATESLADSVGLPAERLAACLKPAPGLIQSLLKTLALLTYDSRAIRDSWSAVTSIATFVSTSRTQIDIASLQDFLQLTTETIIPALCGKHPRMLPHHMHAVICDIGAELLVELVLNTPDLPLLYSSIVASANDALLVESTQPLNEQFVRVCQGNRQLLATLFTLSWKAQTLTRYIIGSEIMDIRQIGVKVLGNMLAQQFNTHRGDMQHPVIQLLARFLRINELTKFLFGPNSHAMLLKESQYIVEYLAATNNYTDHEADIIWGAVTSSAEAEFTQATQRMLTSMSTHFDSDHIFYMLRKYKSVPIEKLSVPCLDLLSALFSKLHVVQEHRTEIALLCVDILCHFVAERPAETLLQLRSRALGELKRVYGASTFDERIILYEYVAPKISDPTSSKDMLIIIMNTFLALAQMSEDEAPKLLAMLPLSTALQQLDDLTRSTSVMNASIRMELIMRLAALTIILAGQPPHDELMDFWGRTVGERAAGDKEVAWHTLHSLSREVRMRPVLHHCLRFCVAELPVSAATPNLVMILKEQVDDALREASAYDELLDMPAWLQLLKFRLEDSGNVGLASQNALCNILFRKMHTHALRAQCQFAKRLMETIETFHSDSATSQLRPNRVAEFARLIDLLETMIMSAQSRGSPPDPPSELDLSVNHHAVDSHFEAFTKSTEDNNAAGERCFKFSLQVFGTVRQRSITVSANPSTKLQSVADALVNYTGTGSNFAILNGKDIPMEQLAGNTLQELKIDGGGSLVIRPRYAVEDNLDLALPPLNGVEQSVFNDFNRLEPLLRDSELARDTYRFVRRLRRPADARRRIVETEDVTGQFPSEQPFWAMYSMNVLAEEYEIHKLVGIRDLTLPKRAAELLMGFITSSKENHDLLAMAMSTLKDIFLADLEVVVASPPSLEVDLQTLVVNWCDSLPAAGPSIMPLIAYSLLMRLFQNDKDFWERSSKNNQWVRAHSRLLVHLNSNAIAEFVIPMIQACHGTELDGPKQFYLAVIATVVPVAVESGRMTDEIVNLFQYCFLHQANKDEIYIRVTLENMARQLFRHNHTESYQFSAPDMVVLSLLKMLSTIIEVLKTHKKPLDLGGFALNIAARLLLPPLQDPSHMPLLADSTRQAACEVIKYATDSDQTIDALLDHFTTVLEQAPVYTADPQLTETYPGCKDPTWTRPLAAFSGLKNYNLTCYVNSLLQQLYANQDFRTFLLRVPLVAAEKQKTLAIMQKLFSRMQNSCATVQHTEELLEELHISKNEQDDAHQFYATIMSALEHDMPNGMQKAQFNNFFSGEQVTQIRGDCGHVSSRVEPFIDVPVVVRNKERLTDSLNGFVQGEPLQGSDKYRCSACAEGNDGSLVDAVRRTCLSKIPDNVTFTLKRFSYNVATGEDDKVNDRFEFPLEIDMKPYKLETLEQQPEITDGNSDIFDLVGVVVHSGSMAFGHYWSYVRLQRRGRRDAWIKLEDHWTGEVSYEEVLERSIGGESSDGKERHMNAYVLLYRRRDRPGRSPVPEAAVSLLETVPTELADAIESENKCRYRVKHLFDSSFREMVFWLRSRASHSQLPKALKLMTLYVTRVSLRNKDDRVDHERVLLDLCKAIDCELDAGTSELLLSVANTENLLGWATICPYAPARMAFLRLLLRASTQLTASEERSSQSQSVAEPPSPSLITIDSAWTRLQETVNRVVANLGELDSSFGADCWYSFFSYGAALAQTSAEVTALLLDSGYLSWILDLVRAYWNPKARKRFEHLLPWTGKSYFPVMALLEPLLTLFSHMDLSSGDEVKDGHMNHRIGVQGVRLLEHEIRHLCVAKENRNGTCNSWLSLAVRFADAEVSLEHYWPGLLVCTLSRPYVDEAIRISIREWLRDCFWQKPGRIELETLCMLLSHHLEGVGRDDTDAAATLEFCVYEYQQWTDTTDDDDIICMKYLTRTAAVCGPRIVFHSLAKWKFWLVPQTEARARKRAVDFLDRLVFRFQPISPVQTGTDTYKGPADSDPQKNIEHGAVLDACRVRGVQKLCEVLLLEVETAARSSAKKRAAPSEYAEAAEVLTMSHQWLQKLMEDREGNTLIEDLRVACVETQEVFEALDTKLPDLRTWVGGDRSAGRASPTAAAADAMNGEIEMAGEGAEEETTEQTESNDSDLSSTESEKP